MKVRTAIATAAAAAMMAGGGAVVLALPAAASAHVTTHTIKFTSVQKGMKIFSRGVVAVQDTDVSAGKVIGFDELNIVFNLKTGKGSANVAVDLNGGLLFGTVPVAQSSAPMKGVVTGGVGKFKGATGTIVTKPANNTGTKIAVTITYHT
jgi:hypothetical protein